MIAYIPKHLEGVWELQPQIYTDSRGSFSEILRFDSFFQKTGCSPFVQENESLSYQGVIRGMHLQQGDDYQQAKLVRVAYGSVVDVVVDLRDQSPSFGQYEAVLLTSDKRNRLFVPRGFAHGFITLSPIAVFSYLVDNAYAPQQEVCLNPFDPSLAIDWEGLASRYCLEGQEPLQEGHFILSDKDKEGISLEVFQKRLQ